MNKKMDTNRKAMTELIKNLDDVSLAILRERIVTICEATVENSKNWDSTFIAPKLYVHLNDEVQKYIGFDK